MESTKPALYLGVWLETSSSVLAPIFAITKDPKLSRVFEDGSKIKTHCASDGGRILPRAPVCDCSTDEFVAGNLRRYLPAQFFPRFRDFVSRIAQLAPGLLSPETVVFAPAIEWWMDRVNVSPDMRTSVPGLFVWGDGSGWTQGIVQAAATGILAGESVAGRRLDPAELCTFAPSAQRRRSPQRPTALR